MAEVSTFRAASTTRVHAELEKATSAVRWANEAAGPQQLKDLGKFMLRWPGSCWNLDKALQNGQDIFRRGPP